MPGSKGSRLCRKKRRGHARLDAFARGFICGLRAAGKRRDAICAIVAKTDGARPSIRAVDAVLSKKRKLPNWQGESTVAGGRPQALSTHQEKLLVDLVFRERCKHMLRTLDLSLERTGGMQRAQA